jgi:phosphoenolpyruvate---glycerone phosphotransferase subunit DhaL
VVELAVNCVSTSEVLQILDDITSEISHNRDYLTELDSQGGDGDHGVNLERGFLKVRSQLPQLRNSSDIGSILTTVGATLLSTVGGATGSLYGAALIKAGSVCRGKTEIRALNLAEILNVCIATLTELGGAKAGDKTMLDVLLPTAEAISQAVRESNDLVAVSAQGAKAARAGLENTKTMVAKRGRASYLGDRTLGHYDVGAASLCLMIESCAKTVSRFEKSP